MIMSMFDVVAITNRSLCPRPLTEQIERIAKGRRPDRLILREKDLMEEEYETLALEMMDRCSKNEIDCILHTYVEVAIRLGCKKIHVSVANFEKNREQFSFFEEIGVSVHSLEEAIWAQKNGATYLIAGHIFSTDCKKGIPPRGLDFLKEVCGNVTIPVYAIGGIDEEKFSEIKEAGAKGACMMSQFMKR